MSFAYYDHIISFIIQNINPDHINYIRVKDKMNSFFDDTRSLSAMVGLKKIEEHVNKREKQKLKL